jgi:hypothetical protein
MTVKLMHSYAIISSLFQNLQAECESRRQQAKWNTQSLPFPGPSHHLGSSQILENMQYCSHTAELKTHEYANNK